MKKEIIEVPKEVRYISEWLNFPLQQLSTGHCIVNKTITGCGYTHFCLTNNQNVILCSPRKFLLENKHRQLKDEYNIHLVVNDGEKVLDLDCSMEKSAKKNLDISEDPYENSRMISNLKEKLLSYVFKCKLSQTPIKILVTYDSLKYVIEVLEKELQYYSIIVDEFQNIFMDSSFKAETELNFVSVLQDCPNVTYLSATPYIEEYLNELDEFKSLPYYELKWDESCLRTVEIEFRKTSSISKEVDKIIDRYKVDNFPIKITEDRVIHEAREVVFYVNSVRMICSIVKRHNLSKDEVNIICADTPQNKKSLDNIGMSFGKAPTIKEAPFKYTFCTRTVYTGADFYSKCALSVIVSDCKIDSLSTDIRMDFPQIMGRQRLKENVFRDECIFIFSLEDRGITTEQFEEISKAKLERSQTDLLNYEIISKNKEISENGLTNLMFDFRNRIKTLKYQNDYTGIDSKKGKPVINKLVYLSEKRAFEIRSDIYKSELTVYNEFNDIPESVSFGPDMYLKGMVEETKIFYQQSSVFTERLKLVCELFLFKAPGRISISDLPWLSRDHKNYLNYLGPEKIRALSYVEADIKREITSMKAGSKIRQRFLETFIVGERYTLSNLKETIKNIYLDLEIKKSPKASDILEFFEVKKCLITIDKKKVNGYELLSIKL